MTFELGKGTQQDFLQRIIPKRMKGPDADLAESSATPEESGATQRDFLQRVMPRCLKDPGTRLINGMDAIAAMNPQTINLFLESMESDAKMSMISPDHIAIAANLDLRLKWLCRMKKVAIRTEIGMVKGVRVPSSEVSFFKSTYKNEDYTLARIRTKSMGDFYFAIPGKQLGYGLMGAADRLFLDMEPDDRFGGLQFPAVNLNLTSTFDWLTGLQLTSSNRQFSIDKAFQHINLSFDHQGVCEPNEEKNPSGKPDLIIRTPFMIWGGGFILVEPLFAACLETDSFVKI